MLRSLYVWKTRMMHMFILLFNYLIFYNRKQAFIICWSVKSRCVTTDNIIHTDDMCLSERKCKWRGIY